MALKSDRSITTNKVIIVIVKQSLKFWEITIANTISQKTTKAIVAAYKQKFGATVWRLFHAKVDSRRRYLFPEICGMLAQLVWVEENNFEPVVSISTNEKMIYLARLEEFTCEDTSDFHAYLGVFYAWWVDTFKSEQAIRLKQAINIVNLGTDNTFSGEIQ